MSLQYLAVTLTLGQSYTSILKAEGLYAVRKFGSSIASRVEIDSSSMAANDSEIIQENPHEISISIFVGIPRQATD